MSAPETDDTTVCILNGKAGSSRAESQCAELRAAFADMGKQVRLIVTRDGDEMARSAQEAAKRKNRLVLAGGGDGTINTVARGVVDTRTALGVLPMGTLNHFAKELKIPLRLEEAVANAFTGEVARVDVGEVNGHIFLNNSSLGLYPGLVQVREALERSGHRKWPAFARALAFALWRYTPLSVRFNLRNEDGVSATTPFVFVGNNKYELAAPHAGERVSLQSGKLWICEAPHAGRARLMWLAVRTLLGHSHHGDLVTLETKEFWIRTPSGRIRVANDGEVLSTTSPLHYRSKPGALRVIVPRSSDLHGS